MNDDGLYGFTHLPGGPWEDVPAIRDRAFVWRPDHPRDAVVLRSLRVAPYWWEVGLRVAQWRDGAYPVVPTTLF